MAAGEWRKRSFVKMLTYRAILTALLAMISWIFTGNLGQTTIITADSRYMNSSSGNNYYKDIDDGYGKLQSQR